MTEKVEIKLYRESMNKAIGKGSGDDAIPYIGEHIMSVADGAGGRAYALQPDINSHLLDPDCSFEEAVAHIISPEEDNWDSYKEQYMENFFNDGFNLSTDYQISGGRKSSYFGSRLASIFMRRLIDINLPDNNLEAIFNDLYNMDANDKKIKMQQLGDKFARSLYGQMKQAAENCHLAFGRNVSVSNVNLMSTTYSGIVYWEADKHVDVLSIQAGDSLPYAITSDDTTGVISLKLLQFPQERKDGGMTNCICADQPFELTFSYIRLQKPCALLCASDGCFDAFSTPAHFERYIFNSIKTGLQSGDLNETTDKMKQFFMSGVTSDDSSSLVFKAFDASIDMRFRMQERVDILNKMMNLDDPTWYSEAELPEDSLKAIDILRDQIIIRYKKELLEQSSWLQDAVWGHYSESEEEIERRKKQLQAAEETIKETRYELERSIQNNWLLIQKASHQTSFGYQHTHLQILNSLQRKKEFENEKKRMLQGKNFTSLLTLKREIQSAVSQIPTEEMNSTETLYGSIIESCQTISRIVQEIEDIAKSINYYDDRIKECSTAIDQTMKELFEDDRLLIKLYCMLLSGEINKPYRLAQGPIAYAEEYAEKVRAILVAESEWENVTVKDIVELMDELEGIQDVPPQSNSISAALVRLKEGKQNIYKIIDDFKAAKVEALKREYMDRPLKLAKECVLEHSDTINEKLRNTIQEALRETQEERDKLMSLVEKKSEAADMYHREYESLLSQEVAKCQSC